MSARRYRRRPDVVEAMQWAPSEPSMQDVLTWLREEGQVFKTVGRQLWIEFGDTRKSWMVVHSGDYVVRKTEGKRYFYAEGEKNFGEAREPLVEEYEALLDIERAAKGVRHARKTYLSVADAEGYYERLADALARLDAIRTTDTSPLTLGASATGHDRKEQHEHC